MTLIQQGYVATDRDIETLTATQLQAAQSVTDGHQTYLRALVATAQKELGVKPRARAAAGRPHRLSDEEIAKQLAALAMVHRRFYEIVVRVIDDSLTGVPAKERVAQKNRRSNFARTALYSARIYVRSGHDMTALVPSKISKSSLAVTVPTKPPTAKRLKSRLERLSKTFVTAMLELGETDKAAAVTELDTLIGIMASQLATLGVHPARDIERAVAEHKPFKSGATLFIPTQSTVLRQQARPS